MSRLDDLRLMAKVARMYYVQGIRQQGITERLQIHQSTVSRLLKRAREAKLVRFSVTTPPGIFSEIEDQLAAKFQLKDAVVVDCPSEEDSMVRDLGVATAYFVETTVKAGGAWWTSIPIPNCGRSTTMRCPSSSLMDARHSSIEWMGVSFCGRWRGELKNQ